MQAALSISTSRGRRARSEGTPRFWFTVGGAWRANRNRTPAAVIDATDRKRVSSPPGVVPEWQIPALGGTGTRRVARVQYRIRRLTHG